MCFVLCLFGWCWCAIHAPRPRCGIQLPHSGTTLTPGCCSLCFLFILLWLFYVFVAAGRSNASAWHGKRLQKTLGWGTCDCRRGKPFVSRSLGAIVVPNPGGSQLLPLPLHIADSAASGVRVMRVVGAAGHLSCAFLAVRLPCGTCVPCVCVCSPPCTCNDGTRQNVYHSPSLSFLFPPLMDGLLRLRLRAISATWVGRCLRWSWVRVGTTPWRRSTSCRCPCGLFWTRRPVRVRDRCACCQRSHTCAGTSACACGRTKWMGYVLKGVVASSVVDVGVGVGVGVVASDFQPSFGVHCSRSQPVEQHGMQFSKISMYHK